MPEFKGPIEGWVVNFLRKNMWRVERTQERDDMMQEAHVLFLKLKKIYPEMDTPQHFMALFKTSWNNKFIDLANADTQRRQEVRVSDFESSDDDRPSEGVMTTAMGDSDNDGALSILIRQAPSEVKSVINLFLNAPQEMLDMALNSWRGRDKRCKTGGSQKICKLLGLPENLDVMKVTFDYLSSK